MLTERGASPLFLFGGYMAKKKWIAGAIKHEGALTAQAKATGQSIEEFCQGKTKGKTGKRCRLAKTLKGLPKWGK